MMKEIAKFLQNILFKSKKNNSANPVSAQDLLSPLILAKLLVCIKQYQQTYPNQDITFTETYRNNTLQLIHHNNGASIIKKSTMHHYGIAADSIFIINGKNCTEAMWCLSGKYARPMGSPSLVCGIGFMFNLYK